MIKVIIERHLRKGEDVSPVLRELRAAAMRYPGYVTGESLVGAQDKSLVLTISTWRNLEDWKKWETSEARAKLYQQMEPLLVGKPDVRVYQIMVTENR